MSDITDKYIDEITKNLIEGSNVSVGLEQDGEPDTGFTLKGKKRILGVDNSKPEPWFEKGGYTQWSYPKATQIYDKQKRQQILQVIKKVKHTGVKYDNFQEDVGSWDKYGSEDYSTNYDISDILDD